MAKQLKIYDKRKLETFTFKKSNSKKRFVVIRDSKGRFVSVRKPSQEKKIENKNYITRQKVNNRLEEVKIKKSITYNGNKKINYGTNTKKKGYRYLVVGINPKTNKPFKFSNNSDNPYDTRKHKGQDVQAVSNAVGTKRDGKSLSDSQAREEAYNNFYNRVSASFLGYSDVEAGREYVIRKKWLIEEDIVWYEEY